MHHSIQFFVLIKFASDTLYLLRVGVLVRLRLGLVLGVSRFLEELVELGLDRVLVRINRIRLGSCISKI